MVGVATSSEQTMQFRYAALMTLGFVSEDLQDVVLPTDKVQQILVAMITNISIDNNQGNQKITEIACETLLRVMPLTKDCYGTPEHHKYIIEQGIFAGIQTANIESQMASFNSLNELIHVAPVEVICEYAAQIGILTGNVVEAGYNEDNAKRIKALLYFWH